MKIIFICTSNVCRSIMAEAIFREKIKKYKKMKERIEIYSAGTFAQDGEIPLRTVVETMQEIRNRCRTIQIDKSSKF